MRLSSALLFALTLATGACSSSSPPSAAPASCEPDTRDFGSCNGTVGISWNGSACGWKRGCICEGNCGGLYATVDACEAAHQHCPRTDAGADADADASADVTEDAGADTHD